MPTLTDTPYRLIKPIHVYRLMKLLLMKLTADIRIRLYHVISPYSIHMYIPYVIHELIVLTNKTTKKYKLRSAYSSYHNPVSQYHTSSYISMNFMSCYMSFCVHCATNFHHTVFQHENCGSCFI